MTLDSIIIGTHKIVVTKDKYYSKIKTLQVKEGETYELNFELDPSDQYLKELREAELKAREEAKRKAIEIARAEEAARLAAERKELYAKQVTGYSSIVNLSYTVKTGHDYFGVDYIGGYRFNNKNFLGVGVGIRFAPSPEKMVWKTLNEGASLPGNSYSAPIYFHYRLNFFNGRFSPYFGLSAGANLSTPTEMDIDLCTVKYTTIGGFLNPQLGLNYRMTPKSSIYFAVGFNVYTMSKCIDNTGYNATFKHSLYYSADFHLGLTF